MSGWRVWLSAAFVTCTAQACGVYGASATSAAMDAPVVEATSGSKDQDATVATTDSGPKLVCGDAQANADGCGANGVSDGTPDVETCDSCAEAESMVSPEVVGLDSETMGDLAELPVDSVDAKPDISDVETAADSDTTEGELVADQVEFVWPNPPLTTPIEATSVSDCAAVTPVNDPSSASECATATAGDAMTFATCTGKPGYLYVVGGIAYQSWLDDGELSATPLRLDLKTGVWQKLAPMPHVKFIPLAEFVNGQLIVASGSWYIADVPGAWPGKYEAPCSKYFCQNNVFSFANSTWAYLPKFITAGGYEKGAMRRIECNLAVTNYDEIQRFSGNTLDPMPGITVASGNEYGREQALVAWGSRFALVARKTTKAQKQTPSIVLLSASGQVLPMTLPDPPCKLYEPFAWTSGNNLFVTSWQVVEEPNFNQAGCVGISFKPGFANVVHSLRWTGTHWTKAPNMPTSEGPATVVDTPVGAIAISTGTFAGKMLPTPDKTYSGIMVQDKKTFIWKDDVYPPMPHGKVGAAAAWSPK